MKQKPIPWWLYAWIVSLICLLGFVQGAKGMSCETDAAPYLVGSAAPAALCSVANASNSECWTFLSDPANSSDVWGTLPKPETVTGVGVVDSFTVNNNAVVVTFSRERLVTNATVSGNVRCGSESYAFNFTPQYLDYSGVTDAAFTFKDRTAEYLLWFLVIIVALILAFTLWRAVWA